jgi:hypothetical protein
VECGICVRTVLNLLRDNAGKAAEQQTLKRATAA